LLGESIEPACREHEPEGGRRGKLVSPVKASEAMPDGPGWSRTTARRFEVCRSIH
jgi:hypothetical protein